METYAERLVSQLTDYQSTDPLWIRFIKDHRDQLLASATTVEIDAGVMHSFKYQLGELLDEYKVNRDYTWIVLWLNQIKGEWEVNSLSSILVPSDTELQTLLDKYKSLLSKENN